MIMKNRIRIFLLWSFIIFSVIGFQWCQCSQEIDPKEVSKLEKYLIDFSKKMEGHRLQTGPLPPDLEASRRYPLRFKLIDGFFA
jgi:hypothetical protein